VLRPARPDATDGEPRKPGSSFTALTRQVHELGLMRRRYGYYWTKLIGAVLAMAAWVLAFVWIGDSWLQLVSAGVLGVLMTQIAFLGHDAAHRQIFKSGRWNDWVSLIVANLFVGISYGWWQTKHTRHHAKPNVEGADPDIALSAIAMTPAMATRHRSPAALARRPSGLVLLPTAAARGCVSALGRHQAGVRPRQGRAPLGRDDLPGRTARRAARPGLHRAAARHGLRLPGRPAGGVRLLHGLLVRAQPHRHAARVAEAQARLPAPARC